MTWGTVVKRLLVGVTVAAPVLVSIAIVLYAYGLINTIFALPLYYFQQLTGWEFSGLMLHGANIASIILTGLFFYSAGWFVDTRLGKWCYRVFDTLFERTMPHYSAVRNSIKLLIESFGSNEGLVSRVVLVKTQLVCDGYLYGLLAGDCESIFLNGDPEAYVTVFAVHGPVGNSGFVCSVPIKHVTTLRNEDGSDVGIAAFMTLHNLRLGSGLRILNIKSTSSS